MQHKIGIDYGDIIKTRKTKKELPLVGKLSLSVNIEKLQNEIAGLLALRGEQARADRSIFDPASSEHNYHLKTSRGESFINNYEEFYRQYSVIGFQELSVEAKMKAAQLNYSVNDLTPVMRLKGMKNTNYEKYHPFYDERNYTRPTVFHRDQVAALLNSFEDQACRAALVCLSPGQYISPHFDLGPEFVTRTMVPIFTNKEAVVGVRKDGGYYEFHLPADGGIYFINAGFEHYAINGGEEARYQIRICLNGQEDLRQLAPLEPLRFVSDEQFRQHPCSAEKKITRKEENILLNSLREFHLEKSGKAQLL